MQDNDIRLISSVILFYREYQQIYGKMVKLGLVTRLIESVPSYSELKELLLEYKPKGHTLAVSTYLFTYLHTYLLIYLLTDF